MEAHVWHHPLPWIVWSSGVEGKGEGRWREGRDAKRRPPSTRIMSMILVVRLLALCRVTKPPENPWRT